VVVDGVDASPCGGTHPKRTGEVGAIAVLRAQKWGQGQARVEFVCGGRVVKLLAEQSLAVTSAAQSLGCGPAEVAEAAARTRAAERAQQKLADGLAEELCVLLAKELHAAQPSGPVVALLQRPASFARGVASALSASGRIALVAAVDGGRAQLCFARPKGPGPALNERLKVALALLGGKGGGAPDHAQGSGDAAKVQEALEQARAGLQ
jgi:alanyl-tRNA synthetase